MNKTTKTSVSVIFTILLSYWLVSAWTNLTSVSNWDPLTSTVWNDMVTKVNETGNRVSWIFTDWSAKVGIGTNTPGAKLDVVWNIKIADWTQWDWKILTSDANGLATWTDPSYQTVAADITAGTVMSAGNSTYSTADVTLTKGIRLLNIWYYLYPSVISGCFDVHIDATPSSWSFITIRQLPNFNSEPSYSAARHSYVTTTQLVNITSTTAAVHPRTFHSWCGWAYYTVANATLTMIATKVR